MTSYGSVIWFVLAMSGGCASAYEEHPPAQAFEESRNPGRDASVQEPCDDVGVSTLANGDFELRLPTTRIEVNAGERSSLGVRLLRSDGHHAFVTLGVSGLPAQVYARIAVGASTGDLQVVIDASDLATPGEFRATLEGASEGVRRTVSFQLVVLPERSRSEE